MEIDPRKLKKLSELGQGQIRKASEVSLDVIISIAINLWRLERAVGYLELDSESDHSRRLERHFEAARADLADIGVTYEDLDGKRVPDTGDYSLKTLEFVPTEGIPHDIVLETIKPNVFFHGEMIKPGEIIVGIPEEKGKHTD
jgi:hypothetical protein